MFILKFVALIAFLSFISAKITPQEEQDMFRIFRDTVNFSVGQGKAMGVLKPLPEGEQRSARLGWFVADVKEEVNHVLKDNKFGCGEHFNEVTTQTFDANTKNESQLTCAIARLYIAHELAKLCDSVEKKGQRSQVPSNQIKFIDSFVSKKNKPKEKGGNPTFVNKWETIKEVRPLNLKQHLTIFEDPVWDQETSQPKQLTHEQFTLLVCFKLWAGSRKEEDPVIKVIRDMEKDGPEFVEAFTNALKKLKESAKSNADHHSEGDQVVMTIINDEGTAHELTYPKDSCPSGEELLKIAEIMARESTSTTFKAPAQNHTGQPGKGQNPAAPGG